MSSRSSLATVAPIYVPSLLSWIRQPANHPPPTPFLTSLPPLRPNASHSSPPVRPAVISVVAAVVRHSAPERAMSGLSSHSSSSLDAALRDRLYAKRGTASANAATSAAAPLSAYSPLPSSDSTTSKGAAVREHEEYKEVASSAWSASSSLVQPAHSTRQLGVVRPPRGTRPSNKRQQPPPLHSNQRSANITQHNPTHSQQHSTQRCSTPCCSSLSCSWNMPLCAVR